MTDTPGVPPDPDDPENDELPVAPDDGKGDRDEVEEGIGELLVPDDHDSPTSDADAPAPG
jgi:hypothetical protein